MRYVFKYESSQLGSSSAEEFNAASHYHALKLMASWVSAMADQVRNPVAGLTAAANLIEKQMKAFRAESQWNPSIVEEAVRLMQERLARFDNYMMELAGFTRDIEMKPQWIDLEYEWADIHSFVLERVTGDVKIVTEFDGRNPHLYADVDKLRLVLAAIIVNAIEACGSELCPEVCVRTTRTNDAEGGQAGTLIQVCDNGPGFSDVALLAGLNPFFTTKEAGTGLGLAMAEKYVDAHGGSVSISNCTNCQSLARGGASVELFFPDPIDKSKSLSDKN